MAERTYLLLQPTNTDSRLWLEFASVQKAAEAIISRFEHRVQELNPQMHKVSYALKDLYSWLDNMSEVFAMVRQQRADVYVRQERTWLKDQIAWQLQKGS